MSTRKSTRPAAAKPGAGPSSTGAARGSTPQTAETKPQWVFLAPTGLGKRDEQLASTPAKNPFVVSLPHPKTAGPAKYIIDDASRKLYELQKVKEEPKSWFLNDAVQEDGSLFLATPMDPLFILLSVLTKAKSAMFQELYQHLVSDEFPSLHLLASIVSPASLASICDVRDAGDITVVRLNEDLVSVWLQRKVDKLAAHFEQTNFAVGSGSQSSTFIRSSVQGQGATKEDYIKFAIGVLSEYLEAKRQTDLAAHFKVNLEEKQASKATHSERFPEDDAVSVDANGNAIKLATDEDRAFYERDKKGATHADKKPKAAPKKTPKADASMRPITGFFGKKSSS